MGAVHELKTWPPYFEAILRGEKNFEVRRDDRGFQRGDLLRLTYFDPKRQHVDSLWPPLTREITYVLTGGQFGIEPGYVVLGLAETEQPA